MPLVARVPVAAPGSRNLRADEIASALGYTVDYVYELTKRGLLPHVKRRRRVLFPAAWVEAWQAGAELETEVLPDGGRIVRPVESPESANPTFGRAQGSREVPRERTG